MEGSAMSAMGTGGAGRRQHFAHTVGGAAHRTNFLLTRRHVTFSNTPQRFKMHYHISKTVNTSLTLMQSRML